MSWRLTNDHFEDLVETRLDRFSKDSLNRLKDEARRARASEAAKTAALEKINDIRNSIIGLQTLNFSEHVYPLVAALDAAGFKGMGYAAARQHFGTLLERVAEAEKENERLREDAKWKDDAIRHALWAVEEGEDIDTQRLCAALAPKTPKPEEPTPEKSKTRSDL